jgi:hydroxymethylpyrimidine pyrophosphatase-like HAD family hydrolase
MIIAVDFDGTCCEHEYPNIGATIPHCVEVLKKIVQFGHQIMIYTMRDGKDVIELGP